MNLLLALSIGILFGTGVYLMLKRDLIRVVVGINLISSAVNLFIIAASVTRGVAPILPLPADKVPSDPLMQALVLTALVISFAITTLLLTLVYRIYTAHRSLDEEAVRQGTEQDKHQAVGEADVSEERH